MEIKHLTDENFAEETSGESLVVVDFFATWCGPCRILGPILEDVSKELSDTKIVKVDVDECEKTARQFGIMSIPTLVFLKNGKEIDRHIGLMNRDMLVELINQNKWKSHKHYFYSVANSKMDLSFFVFYNLNF